MDTSCDWRRRLGLEWIEDTVLHVVSRKDGGDGIEWISRLERSCRDVEDNLLHSDTRVEVSGGDIDR